MEKRARVLEAVYHRPVDRVPMGELLIDKELVAEYNQVDLTELNIEHWKGFLEELKMDLISLQPGFELNKVPIAGTDKLKLKAVDVSEIKRWNKESDYFIFAVVGGGFQAATTYFDFMEVLMLTKTNPALASEVFRGFTEVNTDLAKRAIEAGADGIIIGDDIAHAGGLYFNPEVMREALFPWLFKQVLEIKNLEKNGKRIPVFFHADGDLNSVLPDLIDLGIDGLHSLEPSAKMDIGQIKKDYGSEICLMGNIDLEKLVPWRTEEEIDLAVAETMEAAKGESGYIFGTCGALSKGLPLKNVKTLYQSGYKWGKY